MISYGKLITSLFVFTLFVCQSGVCTTTIGLSHNAPSEEVHSCNNNTDRDGQNVINTDNGILSAETTGLQNSDCCLDSTLTSRDIGVEQPPLLTLISFFDFNQEYKNPTYTTLNNQNRGHPPGSPVFIQNSTLLI